MLKKHIIKIKIILLIFILSIQLSYSIDISENKHLSEACDRGEIELCLEFANFYYIGVRNGTYDKKYYKVVTAPYHKACDYGIAKACYRLGGIYLMGRGVTSDIPKAYKLYDRACKLDYSLGCITLAFEYELDEEYKKAIELYQKACSLEHLNNCKDRDRLQKLLSHREVQKCRGQVMLMLYTH